MIRTSLMENDAMLLNTSMEVTGSQINTSNFHRSQSSLSNEGDLSFSSSIDQELDALILGDELPAFEIRLVSPLARTPSPIDTNEVDFRTPTRLPQLDCDSTASECLNSDFVTLEEINSLISPPANDKECTADVRRCNSLETIFEGVFLNTPPKAGVRYVNTTRENLFEKLIINRMFSTKENQVPNVGAVNEVKKL
ncbi:uncharacterized protein LOC126763464 [Bactrocera neohumeralis]|uniref:uncharacterized protein LOC120777854 n=1 Tax=Bactrocera tryoni TaxID=59916 RepID=UPI001A9A1122|nr:uncharacterized protein LOC120777854 [Bactrocera tryoni]XP_050336957.1 uncharacterized protein LOC126763464 [Bactrocera neohumeralis]